MPQRQKPDDRQIGQLTRRVIRFGEVVRDGKVDPDFLGDLLNQLNDGKQCNKLQADWRFDKLEADIKAAMPTNPQVRKVIHALGRAIQDDTLRVNPTGTGSPDGWVALARQTHRFLNSGLLYAQDPRNVRLLFVDTLIASYSPVLAKVTAARDWACIWLSSGFATRFIEKHAEYQAIYYVLDGYELWLKRRLGDDGFETPGDRVG